MRKKVDFVCLFNEHVMFNMHYNKLTSIIYYVNYKVTGCWPIFLLAALISYFNLHSSKMIKKSKVILSTQHYIGSFYNITNLNGQKSMLFLTPP